MTHKPSSKPLPRMLLSRIPAWKATTLIERIQYARVLLKVHGLLTEGENKRVIERLKRRMVKEGLEV